MLLFIVLNLALVPFAYFAGIYQLVTQNPYQDRKERRNKLVQVLVFAFLGLPFLIVCQGPNAWFCLKSLYMPHQKQDALASEKTRQSPVNTRNIQRMYQVVSKELLD